MNSLAIFPTSSRDTIADPSNWASQGACHGMDTELFFHPEGERGGTRRRRATAAKAVCATCPVLDQCREYALAAREPYGVWGGMTEEERADYLKHNQLRSA